MTGLLTYASLDEDGLVLTIQLDGVGVTLKYGNLD